MKLIYAKIKLKKTTQFTHKQENLQLEVTDMLSSISVSALAPSLIMRKVGSGGALNTVNLTLPLALFRGR